MIFINLFIILLFFILNYSDTFSIIKLENKDDKIKIVKEVEFNESNLWGYINGGADIYLEYGFKHLLIQDVSSDNEKLRIEIYEMENSKDALGIFLLNTNPTDIQITYGSYSSISKYQCKAVLDNYFISIINSSGNSNATNISSELLDILIQQPVVSNFVIPQIFKKFLKIEKTNLKLLRGKLSFENHAFEFNDINKIFSEFDKYYVSFLSQNKRKSLIILPNTTIDDIAINLIQNNVKFDNDDKTFHKIKLWNDKLYITNIDDENYAIFFDENDLNDFVELTINTDE